MELLIDIIATILKLLLILLGMIIMLIAYLAPFIAIGYVIWELFLC